MSCNSQRISWCDSARGLAILLVIVAHSFGDGNFIKNFIYSFHIPLFFILSGYCLKFNKNRCNLFTILRNNFVHLIFPSIFIIVLCCFIRYGFRYDTVKVTFLSIFYGNGLLDSRFVDYFGIIPLYGPYWFLICLFFSKILYILLELYLSNSNIKNIVYFLFLFLGIIIGKVMWLPLSFDVVFVALFFLKIGNLYRKLEDRIHNDFYIVCFIIWFSFLLNGFTLNLAERYLPLGIFSVIESICGSFVFIYFFKLFDKFWILNYIGKNSLMILIIHSIEIILFDYNFIILGIGIYLFTILRVALIFILFISVKIILYFMKVVSSYGQSEKAI